MATYFCRSLSLSLVTSFELHRQRLPSIARTYQKLFVAPSLVVLISFLIIFTSVTQTELFAQQSPRFLKAGFERDASRYSWTSELNLEEGYGDWDMMVRNVFRSEAFTRRQTISEFRDENRLLWGVQKPLSKSLSMIALGTFDWFSQVDAFNNGSYAGLRYQPLNYWYFQPYLGVAFDQRQGIRLEDGSVPIRNDSGPAMGFKSSLGSYKMGQYVVDYEAEGNWQSLSPRTRRAIVTSGGVSRKYGESIVRLLGRFSNFRRDSYQAASFLNRDQQNNRSPETVEASINDTLGTSLSIESPLSDKIRFTSSLEFDAFDRNIRTLRAPEEIQVFDTDFSRRSVQFRLGLQYRGSALNGRVYAERGATVERRDLVNTENLPMAQVSAKTDLLRQADIDRGSLRLGFNGVYLPSARWSIRLSGLGNIQRHDTPDTNFDDRDELLYTALLSTRYRVSDRLSLLMNLAGDTYHTVYLKASRSIENARRNSLRLYPGLEWRKDIDSFFRFSTEVRATYTVDDFVIEGRPQNDQSARELQYSFVMSQPLKDDLILKADLSTSNLMLGRLQWDEFAEIPFDTLNTSSAWVRLRAGRSLIGEIGWRVLFRSDHDRNTSVRYTPVNEDGSPVTDADGVPLSVLFSSLGRRQITQYGPTCSLSWDMSNNSSILFDGWVQRQKISEKLYGPFPNGQDAAVIAAGKKGTTRYVPNFSIGVLWSW